MLWKEDRQIGGGRWGEKGRLGSRVRETKRRERRKGRAGEMEGRRGRGKKAESLRSRAVPECRNGGAEGAPSLQT